MSGDLGGGRLGKMVWVGRKVQGDRKKKGRGNCLAHVSFRHEKKRTTYQGCAGVRGAGLTKKGKKSQLDFQGETFNVQERGNDQAEPG